MTKAPLRPHDYARPMSRAWRIGVAASLAALFTGGCIRKNDRGEIGRAGSGVRLAFLDDGRDRPEALRKPDAPSVQGLTRANWEAVRMEVPVDGTYAYRRYARLYHMTDQTSRQRGGPVTALSALERSGPTRLTQALEAGAAFPLAAYDVVAMPFRMITAPPWEVVRALPEQHWRRELTGAQVAAEARRAENR